jgi:hypothetical protein
MAANAPVGWALNAIGTLTVVRADSAQEQLQGRKMLPLYESDVVMTDAASQAYMQFNEGINLAMNEQTTLRILSRWQKDKAAVRILRISQGEIWAKTVGEIPKAFEMETPVAAAAAKGSLFNEFNLKVQRDGLSILTVMAGAVEFGTPFNTWWVKTNNFSSGERGKKCTKPEPTDVQAVKSWANDLMAATATVQP